MAKSLPLPSPRDDIHAFTSTVATGVSTLPIDEVENELLLLMIRKVVRLNQNFPVFNAAAESLVAATSHRRTIDKARKIFYNDICLLIAEKYISAKRICERDDVAGDTRCIELVLNSKRTQLSVEFVRYGAATSVPKRHVAASVQMYDMTRYEQYAILLLLRSAWSDGKKVANAMLMDLMIKISPLPLWIGGYTNDAGDIK